MSDCKINVILDLDNTIINAIEMSQKINVPSQTNLEYRDMVPLFRVYARPHLQEFLDFLFDNFNVSVFTAADKDYALFIIENFIYANRPDRKLKVFFYRYHVDKSHKEYGGVKDLRILWDMFKVDGFYPCNTIIIDDLDMVAKTNPYNVLPVKAFYVINDEDEDKPFYNQDASKDDTLIQVQYKLQAIKENYDRSVCSFYGFMTKKDSKSPLLQY
jgi:TFIIF-interacting CTD phosphatase-like protein